MTARQHFIDQFIKEHNLLPLGARVTVIYPKCDEFMQSGTIVAHLEKSGAFYWDYTIRLDSGEITHKVRGSVTPTL